MVKIVGKEEGEVVDKLLVLIVGTGVGSFDVCCQ